MIAVLDRPELDRLRGVVVGDVRAVHRAVRDAGGPAPALITAQPRATARSIARSTAARSAGSASATAAAKSSSS